MKKRIHVLPAALILMLMLVGWGGKEVKLLDSGRLIDLDKAIGLAKPGGMSGDTEEASGPSEDAEDEKEQEGENDGTDPATDVLAKNIDIRIRGERIFYTCGDTDSENIADNKLKDRLRSDYVQDAQVTLTDDFAEAHVYRKALGILEELKTDIGLSYREDRFAGGE